MVLLRCLDPALITTGLFNWYLLCPRFFPGLTNLVNLWNWPSRQPRPAPNKYPFLALNTKHGTCRVAEMYRLVIPILNLVSRLGPRIWREDEEDDREDRFFFVLGEEDLLLRFFLAATIFWEGKREREREVEWGFFVIRILL